MNTILENLNDIEAMLRNAQFYLTLVDSYEFKRDMIINLECCSTAICYEAKNIFGALSYYGLRNPFFIKQLIQNEHCT